MHVSTTFQKPIPGHAEHDRLMNVYIDAEVIGPNLKINKDKIPEEEIHYLSARQIKALTSILLKELQILPGFNLPVWKVLRKIQKLIELEGISSQDFLRCVGSSQARVIHRDKDYVKSIMEKLAAKKLDILLEETATDDIKDLDIRIHLPDTNAGKNMKLRTYLISWLAHKALKMKPDVFGGKSNQDLFDDILKTNNKIWNPYDDPVKEPKGNRFLYFSLGNEKLFTLDIVCEQHLKRTKILSPDGGQIPFNIVKLSSSSDQNFCPFALTGQVYRNVPKKKVDAVEPPLIRPEPSSKKFYRIILDRVLKIVHFPGLKTMDHNGWFKLIQYYGQGYRTCEDEALLFEKVLLWTKEALNEPDLSEEKLGVAIAKHIAEKFIKFINKHYSGNNAGALSCYFNSMMSLYRMGHAKLAFAFMEQVNLTLNSTECLPEIFGFMLSYMGKTSDFEGLLGMMQSYALIYLNTSSKAPSQQCSLTLTFNSGKPAILWEFKIKDGKKASLMMPFNIMKALQLTIKQICGSPGKTTLAEQLWNMFLNDRDYSGKSVSVVHVYLDWLKASSDVLMEQGRACMACDNDFIKKFGMQVFQVSEAYEAYRQPLTSHDQIAKAWESLETHSINGFHHGNYTIFRPYIQSLLKATLTIPQDERQFLWDLLKIKRWVEKYPWIYHEGPLAKYDLLLQCLDSIVKRMSSAKINLAELLQGFFKLYIEEYAKFPEQMPVRTIEVFERTIKVFSWCTANKCPLEKGAKEALEKILPSMMVSLHRLKKGYAILELLRNLRIQKIVLQQTSSTLSATLYAYNEQLTDGPLNEENLTAFMNLVKNLNAAKLLFEEDELKVFYKTLGMSFALLMKVNCEDEALVLLDNLREQNTEIYQSCCQGYLDHAQACLVVHGEFKKCYSILKGEQWQHIRQSKQSACSALAASVVKNCLSTSSKELSCGQIFALIKDFGLNKADLWQLFLKELSKDKKILEESWSYFIHVVLADTSVLDRERYVRCWLLGIQSLSKHLQAKLKHIPDYYNKIKPLLDNSDGGLLETVNLALLSTLAQLFSHSHNDEKLWLLFEEIYQKYKTNSPVSFISNIDLAIIAILSRSDQIEHIKDLCARLMKNKEESIPNNGTAIDLTNVIEGLLLRAGRFNQADYPEMIPVLCSLFDEVFNGLIPIDWVQIFNVFAVHESREFAARAVNILNFFLGSKKGDKKSSHKAAGLSAKAVFKLITFMCDDKDPLGPPVAEMKMESPSQRIKIENPTNEDILLGILAHPLIAGLLKNENVKSIWMKLLNDKLANLKEVCKEGDPEDEAHHLLFTLAHAPDGICTDPLIQNSFIDFLSAYIEKNFFRAMYAETLFLHSALGGCVDLKSYPFDETPPLFECSVNNIQIINPNSKAPYVKDKLIKWFDKVVDFELLWLTCLIEKCDKIDLEKSIVAVNYLNYIGSRIAVLLSSITHSNKNNKRIRVIVEVFFDLMITNPKVEFVERIFLQKVMLGFCSNLKNSYLSDNKRLYDRYNNYYCVMNEVIIKDPKDSLIKGKIPPQAMDDVLIWTLEQIANRKGGINIPYMFALLTRFMKKNINNQPENFIKCLKIIFSELKKGPSRLKTGLQIEHVFASIEDFHKGSPTVSEKPTAPPPKEFEEPMILMFAEMRTGFIATSKAFYESRREVFHPLEKCLQLVSCIRETIFIAGGGIFEDYLKGIDQDFKPEFLEQFRWCIEQGFNKRAEGLRLHYFSLFLSRGMKISDGDKKELALKMLESIEAMLDLFKKDHPRFKTVIELSEKMFNLSRSSGVLDPIPADRLEELASKIAAGTR